ncbi:fungal-specific transcription factor domain-containing protein [Phaeosphaeriaceae sp. PMI808]|nr:fungal-specific transcription factor domain-containing protein [Phaeosphaeriaceae sp. PMI808]
MGTEAHSQREVPASRRRPKPTLSCNLCRRRKLRCDRQQPCKTCIDRGLSLSCTFTRGTPSSNETGGPSTIHDRITQLEQLVTSLIGSKDTETHSPGLSYISQIDHHSDDEKSQITGAPNRVKLSRDTTSYTNSSHWTSILDGISELKDHLDQIPTSAHAQDGSLGDISGPDLLFGRQRHASKQELLAALPTRNEADQLVAGYFDSMTMAPTLLHKPSFHRKYDAFWKHPFEASTMWLGLLYSVFALGERFLANKYEPSVQSENMRTARIDLYREKTAQALILANYTKCPPWTIETFFLYFASEFARSPDTQFGTWMLAGMIVRMALRMGYHRDPSHFANITPFQAEIRRRLWLIILSVDMISSVQVGLPRMILPYMHDTQEPLNVEEEDLHEDMTELPPPRPETKLTPLLSSIITTRLRNSHAQIMDLNNATSQPPYREVMALDARLRHVYNSIPESSKGMLLEDFDRTSPSTTQRLYLGLMFLKAELMLHRPYLLPGRTNTRYEHSRRVCLNAAYEMLQLQQKLDAEIQPGGRLWSPGWQVFTMSWYMSSIVAQDFLLATTVLILDLDEELTYPLPQTLDAATGSLKLDHAPPSQEQIIEILREAQNIWYKASQRSHEAQKAAKAIKLVLDKLHVSNNGTESTSNSHIATDQPNFAPLAPSFDFNDFSTESSNATFFGLNDSVYNNPFATDPMTMDIDMMNNTFNWVHIDTFVVKIPAD